MTALWLLALLGLVGSGLLLVAVLIRWALFSRHALPAVATALERTLLWLALVAALAGSASLLAMPAYQGGSCSFAATVVAPSGTASMASEVSIPTADCTANSATFLQMNGPQLLPLFTLPVLFALIPFAFRHWRFRSLVYAPCAFLLAAQAAMGMSGYGLVFAPSSVALLLAGLASILRLREHAA